MSATAVREHSRTKTGNRRTMCGYFSSRNASRRKCSIIILQQLSFDSKNGIALVSYQGEGTPGKKLLDTGTVSTRGTRSECYSRSKTI